jgi:hypothetical protein
LFLSKLAQQNECRECGGDAGGDQNCSALAVKRAYRPARDAIVIGGKSCKQSNDKKYEPQVWLIHDCMLFPPLTKQEKL